MKKPSFCTVRFANSMPGQIRLDKVVAWTVADWIGGEGCVDVWLDGQDGPFHVHAAEFLAGMVSLGLTEPDLLTQRRKQ